MVSMRALRRYAGSSFRRHCLLLVILMLVVLCRDGGNRVGAAQAPIRITPVSAASFAQQIPLAPGSIAAIFLDGDVVAPGTIVIGNDSNPSTPEVELPTVLENLSVEVHGRSAGIFFLSARQWNILLPGDLLPGTGPIVIRDATGLIRAAGEIEIARVTPAIFTANVSGQGVPAAFLLRVLANGQQRLEQVADFDPVSQRFAPKPIDLERGDELVFLILYLTGAQGIIDANETRILIGGAEYIPDFVGQAPGFLGLEQINMRLPRSLPTGLLQVQFVYLADGRAANACEIEVAPPTGSPPSIRGLSKAEALAGEVIEVTGTGFTPDSEVLITDATRKAYNTQLMEASSTSLKVMVPFGSGTGNLIVRNARGEASFPFRMRTSMSGIVQRITAGQGGSEQRVGIRNVTIRIRQNNVERTAMTNDDGSFIIPDVTPTARLTFEVDGATNGLLPLPKDVRSLPVVTGRDNQYEGYIELKEISGPSSFAGSNGVLTQQVVAPVRGRDEVAQPSPVVFDPQGSVARFPDGTVLSNITATALDPGRVPANLPPAQFSSTIVQLTQFGAMLDPGGKLTFPNTDGYAANETVTLYRFDQVAGSNTLGAFVAAGQARVTADGMRVETASNAIKETTYYFVSKPRRITTIYGKVEEEIDGGVVHPARGALVQVRGQSIFSLTDQSGTYTLRNVPIPDAATLANGFGIEVSFLRPDGTVDRVDREGVVPGIAGLTLVTPPIRIVARGRTTAPVIQGPKSLTVEAGKQSEFNFLAYARVAGRTLTNVQVTGAAFATVASIGNDRYVLRLAPGADAAGTFTLELRASDSAGEMTSQTVLLEVKAGEQQTPVALSQSIETNEDEPVNVVLTGTGGNQFRIISDPRRGRLSGTAPNLTYTPEADFNGTDAFSFVLGNGTAESAPTAVTVNVRAVSDAPRLTVGDRFTTNIGQRLAIVVNGYDGDAEQTLTLVGTGLPTGAVIRQASATSWVLEWRPASDQIGTYTVNLTLSDSGAPVQSASKPITIIVDATWALTSGPEGAVVFTMVAKGKAIFSGASSGGVYRTVDNGVTWAAVGIPGARDLVSFAVVGSTLYAGTLGSGIYRTTDNGGSWMKVGSTLSNSAVYALVVSGTTLYAGTFGGVFRSTDNGATWTPINNGLTNTSVQELLIDGSTIYAGTFGGGVFRTTDDGANWTAVNNGLTSLDVRALMVRGSTIFVGTTGGAFRTTDNGDNWTPANNGLGTNVYAVLTVGETLYAGRFSGGVYRSTDNGDNWTRVSNGLTNNLVNTLLVNGATLFAGTTGGGVYRTPDGGANWTQATNGMTGSNVLAQATIGATLFAGTLGNGIYRTTDDGANWVQVNNGLPVNFVYSLAADGGTLYAGLSGLVCRTTDGGANWVRVNNGLDNSNFFALAVKGAAVFAGGNGGVFRTTDNGANWTRVNNGLTSTEVRSLAVSGTQLFAGTPAGGVFRTTDDGANWAAVNNGLTLTNVRSLAAIGSTLYAGTLGGSGIYQTTDNGANWTPARNGLPGLVISSITGNGTTLYAGTGNSGVFRAAGNGADWTPLNTGLTNRVVNSLIVSGPTLYAGTFGGGVFTLAEAGFVWSESNTGLGNRDINAAIAGGARTLVGTFEGGVYRSDDGGATWMSSNNGISPSADIRAFTRHNSNVFAGLNGEGVYVSMDDGANWSARSTGLGNQSVNALASDGARLFAGTDGGVFRSLDNGGNWTQANTGITRQKILSLLAAPSGLYAGTDLGLFRSTDGGETWTAVNTGLGDLYIVSLGAASDATTIVAGTTGGVYRSTNQGQNWTKVTSGLPDRVTALTFTTSGAKLLAGTVYGFYVSEDNGMNWSGSSTGLLNLQVSGLVVEGERVIAGTRSAGVFVSRLE